MMDIFMTTTGFIVWSDFGYENALTQGKHMRRELILTKDSKYENFLKTTYAKYPTAYRNEKDMFM